MQPWCNNAQQQQDDDDEEMQWKLLSPMPSSAHFRF
jgi:hypothetical protein